MLIIQVFWAIGAAKTNKLQTFSARITEWSKVFPKSSSFHDEHHSLDTDWFTSKFLPVGLMYKYISVQNYLFKHFKWNDSYLFKSAEVQMYLRQLRQVDITATFLLHFWVRFWVCSVECPFYPEGILNAFTSSFFNFNFGDYDLLYTRYRFPVAPTVMCYPEYWS